MPPTSEEIERFPPRIDLCHGVNGSPIKCYCTRSVTIDIGLGRHFVHDFFIADVCNPLLGFDFLARHQLFIDCLDNALVDKKSSGRQRGVSQTAL